MLRSGRNVLIAIAILLVGAAVYSSYLILQRQETLAEASRYNLQWSATQAVVELMRLELALSRPAIDSEADWSEAELRLDIMTNRLSLMRHGEFATYLAMLPQLAAHVTEARDRLDRVRAWLEKERNPTTAQKALDELRPLESGFVAIASSANRYGGELVASEQSALLDLHWLFSGLIGGLIVVGMGMIGLLFRHNRALLEAHAYLKRSSAELRVAGEAAAAASRAKSEFLAKMSHEIRTPMNGVLGMTELLSHTTLDGRQRRLVATIKQSAHGLLAIINDILDLSRIEAGRMKLEQRELDVRQMVEGAVELFAEQAAKKGVDLVGFVDASVPDLVVGDLGRLRQVCVNLIGNGVKFTSAGEVSVRVTRAAGKDGDDRLRIEVADTGIGIDRSIQSRLFEPFTQADNSIARRFGGTGLGLSISRHLVELMAGTIALDSEVGKGTRLIVELPLVEAAALPRSGTGDEAMAAADGPAAGLRLIVVGKPATRRDVVVAYLAAAGAEVTVADAMAPALTAIGAAGRRAARFDAAVLDLSTPGVTAALLPPSLDRVEVVDWSAEPEAATGRARRVSRPIRRDDLVAAVAACRADQAAEHAPAASASVAAAPALTARAHVLLAEDNPVNEEVAKSYLELLGITCDVARTGVEAVALAGERRYPLILMDCMMPEMDGLTATRRIRERERAAGASRTPIVAVTANAFAEDREACKAAGMDDHLGKPFFEDQLAAIVDRWLMPGRKVA